MSALKSLIINIYNSVRPGGKPISRKVIAQALTSAIMFAVGYVALRLGVHQIDPSMTAILAAAASAISGAAAGYLRRELPEIVSDK